METYRRRTCPNCTGLSQPGQGKATIGVGRSSHPVPGQQTCAHRRGVGTDLLPHRLLQRVAVLVQALQQAAWLARIKERDVLRGDTKGGETIWREDNSAPLLPPLEQRQGPNRKSLVPSYVFLQTST